MYKYKLPAFQFMLTFIYAHIDYAQSILKDSSLQKRGLFYNPNALKPPKYMHVPWTCTL